MIVQNIYLSKYNWDITVYYAVDKYYSTDILNELMEYDPSYFEYNQIKGLMENYELNTGFTFTNYNKKKSLVVIGLTSSSDEFQDTFDHEKGHLTAHISQYYNINPYGEDYQYLAGEIGKKLFPIAKLFICEHCRQELKKKFFM